MQYLKENPRSQCCVSGYPAAEPALEKPGGTTLAVVKVTTAKQVQHRRLGKLFPAGMRPGNVSSCLELDIDADTPAAKLTAVRKQTQ